MAYAWDVLAEQLGKTAERTAGTIRKKADEERLEERTKNLLKFRKKLDSEALEQELKFKSGFDSLQYSVSQDLQGMMPEEAEATQGAVLKARQGYDVDPNEFTLLSPLNQAKIADVLQANKLQVFKNKIQRDKIQIELDQLAAYIARTEASKEIAEARAREGAKEKPIDIKRWMDMRIKLNDKVDKAEKDFSEYRSKLFNDLEEKNIINKEGEVGAAWFGMRKGSLVDPETGVVDEEIKTRLLGKYPRYRARFERLETLRKNVEERNRTRDEFFGGEPPVATEGIDPKLQKELDRLGITVEQAEELLRQSKR